jgi:hypothetical protein
LHSPFILTTKRTNMKIPAWLSIALKKPAPYHVNVTYKYHKPESRCLIVYNMSKFRLTDLRVELGTSKGIKLHHRIESINVKMAVPIHLTELFPDQNFTGEDRITRIEVHFKNFTDTFVLDEAGMIQKG